MVQAIETSTARSLQNGNDCSPAWLGESRYHPNMAWRHRIIPVAGVALLLTACGTTSSSQPATTSTTNRVILKVSDGCQQAVNYVDTHTSSTVPGLDSVIAASCTPAELRAALAKRNPSLIKAEIAAMEGALATSLCASNPNLRLCTGTPASPATATAPCAASQLQLTLDRVVPGLMQQPGAFFRLTNTSNATCSLNGYPTLQPISPAGQVIGAAVRNGGSYQISDPGPHAVVLEPNTSAFFGFGWGNVTPPNGTNAGCVNTVEVRSVPPGSQLPLQTTAQLPSVCPGGYPSVTVVALAPVFVGSPAKP